MIGYDLSRLQKCAVKCSFLLRGPYCFSPCWRNIEPPPHTDASLLCWHSAHEM